MRLDFAGRTALVTGAAQGIGRAIAESLLAAGAKVHLADIAPIAWNADGVYVTHQVDLGERAAVQRLIADVGALDILVNAAGGVRGQVGGPIENVDEASWRAIFAANVDSAFWLGQAASTPMRKAGYGRIVTISSGAGLRPSLTGIQAYTAAKHALVGLTKQLSQDLGPFGITCNSVAPGFVRSNPTTERQWLTYSPGKQAQLVESIHTRRLGTAQDIANAVLFLASEQAGWISGQILSVDGGRS
ncbi:MAG: SDR family oxidoreductase [Telmatospirillum sp.]|nr:SDR family oxidoreductase [Telmatospirillum sp.]